MQRRPIEPVDRTGLARFFNQMVRQTFRDLDYASPAVVNYTADMLMRFARTDALFRIRNLDGRRLETAVDLLIEADASAGNRELDVRRHTGDYTLFMSGLFRAHVEHNGYLDFYLTAGGRAYARAAELHRRLAGSPETYEELSRRFEEVSGALDFMRKVHFQAEAGSAYGDLLRRLGMLN